MKNKVYLLWLSCPKKHIDKFLDSVWENEHDVEEHVCILFDNPVFKDYIVFVEEKQLYKHI